MRVAVTGATGLIGSTLVAELVRRGDEVVAFSRTPERARERLGVQCAGWDPGAAPAPAAALAGCDAVVNLAGENVAQRWTERARWRIRDSRLTGTRNLLAGLQAADPRPRTLVSGSAVGYYGPRGSERLDEQAAVGEGFLADVTAAWEQEAARAGELGLRVVILRTGVVLDRDGGALARMLPPFRLGIGGPVAGGRQYVPWVHLGDVVGMILAALDDDRWRGPVNVTAPEPVTNAELSRALGRALHRPALMPVPALALRLLYGAMAEIVTTGQRAVPARAQELGYRFRQAELDGALTAALASD